MAHFDIASTVRAFLDENNYHYRYEQEGDFFTLNFNLKCKLKSVRIIFRCRKNDVLCYGISPISGDKDNPEEMLKYLAMANYGLNVGNFEMDLRDGEIRYKVNILCHDLPSLPFDHLDSGLSFTINEMNRYGDGIAALAMGFSDAKTEIQKAEADR